MIEFTKYERNVMYAEAVSQVGTRAEYWVDDAKADIERYEKCISDRIEANKDDNDFNPDDDWQIRSWVRNKIVAENILGLYEKMQNVVDKELSF